MVWRFSLRLTLGVYALRDKSVLTSYLAPCRSGLAPPPKLKVLYVNINYLIYGALFRRNSEPPSNIRLTLAHCQNQSQKFLSALGLKPTKVPLPGHSFWQKKKDETFYQSETLLAASQFKLHYLKHTLVYISRSVLAVDLARFLRLGNSDETAMYIS